MGTRGYERARDVTYRPDEVILEVGRGASTLYLAGLGPLVVSVDVDADDVRVPNVESRRGRAEYVLDGWDRPVGFAWLDGWDWPYDGNPPEYYEEQRARYARNGQVYSQEASRRSHLRIAELIADRARVVAFDDTWRTHRGTLGGPCACPIPPATQPAPALAMDRGIDRSFCGLDPDHPHHDRPDVGWNGKGGDAVPYLLGRSFDVAEYGLGLVVLERRT